MKEIIAMIGLIVITLTVWYYARFVKNKNHENKINETR